MNHMRTAILLAGLTALFMGVGFLIGGRGGMLIALVVAAAMNLFSYWNSSRMVLSMHGAEEVDERSSPEFYGMVRDLARRAELPMPKVYVMHEDQPNAFATGRNPENAAVAATTGLLNALSKEEVAGVMAHELAHVKNHDTLIMTVTATIAGAISMLTNFSFFFSGNRENSGSPYGWIGSIAMMILAPVAAMIVQMAISRAREYEADKMGAEICGNPEWLASALQTMERVAHRTENESAERNPATAHMFIINPLSGAGMDNLFSTHPATENRVAALKALSLAMGGETRSPASVTDASPGPDASRGPWGGAPQRPRAADPWGRDQEAAGAPSVDRSPADPWGQGRRAETSDSAPAEPEDRRRGAPERERDDPWGRRNAPSGGRSSGRSSGPWG